MNYIEFPLGGVYDEGDGNGGPEFYYCRGEIFIRTIGVHWKSITEEELFLCNPITEEELAEHMRDSEDFSVEIIYVSKTNQSKVNWAKEGF